MNDYKELIEQLNGACIVKVVMKDMTKADLFALAADAIEQLLKERDAAVEDLFGNCCACAYEEHLNFYGEEPCQNCDGSKWEWRGVKEEEKWQKTK